MARIAIISGPEIDMEYNEIFVAQHITEWTEVSEQELAAIREGLYMDNNHSYGKYGIRKWQLIEFPDQLTVVNDLIEKGRKVAEAKAAQEEARKKIQEEASRKREETRKKNAEAKAANDKINKLKKLQQLSKELGVEIKEPIQETYNN